MTIVTTEIPSIQAIVTLARELNDTDAARLIEKYTDAIASIRVADACRELNHRVIGILEGSFHPVKEEA